LILFFLFPFGAFFSFSFCSVFLYSIIHLFNGGFQFLLSSIYKKKKRKQLRLRLRQKKSYSTTTLHYINRKWLVSYSITILLFPSYTILHFKPFFFFLYNNTYSSTYFTVTISGY
jgi:hypothetical protein